MEAIDENKIKQDGRIIWHYSIGYYSKKLPKDKVIDKINKITGKIAGKLGLDTCCNVLTGNLPGAKLANFTASYLKVMTFESYFNLNPNLNPYDPITQEDEYSEYLLYSWARGKPGYQFFDVASAWNPNYKKR
ncbi:MAG: hypothetical protein ACR2GD_09515 [Pyrinomonadaceae bacterium]